MLSTADYFKAAKEEVMVDKEDIRERVSRAMPPGIDPGVREQSIEEQVETIVEEVTRGLKKLGFEKNGDSFHPGLDMVDDYAPVSSVSLDDADIQDEINKSLRKLEHKRHEAEKLISNTIDAAINDLSEYLKMVID